MAGWQIGVAIAGAGIEASLVAAAGFFPDLMPIFSAAAALVMAIVTVLTKVESE